MSNYNIINDEIKSKIRKFKKLEIKIRFGNNYCVDGIKGLSATGSNKSLVWDEFFDLHEECKNKAKYSICKLAEMDKDEFRNVISEYFFNVYYKFYRENGIVNMQLYDADILVQMGLPYDADINSVKKRFRELAKKYHPDTGGDSTKFIELMDNYKKLVDS